MGFTPRILAFAGSTRAESLNRTLVRLAADGARAANAEVTELDLRDYRLPVFDADLEKTEGFPDGARRLQEVFLAHDGLLIASPEHNTFVSAALKNTIDWISRNRGDLRGLDALENKVAGIMSASPGRLGGLRGLNSLRTLLTGIKVLVLPGQVTVERAKTAFDGDGRLIDAGKAAAVAAMGRAVADHARKLRAPDGAPD